MPPEKAGPIKLLIVDDSFFMRKMLQDIFAETNGAIQVVDTAQNGLEALEKTKKLKPDVITLDVEMPKMDGLTALEKIMKERPTPVVMLSSHTGKGAEATIRALEMGAVDCVAKPAGRVLENVRAVQGELIEKIKMAALCGPQIQKLSHPKYPVPEGEDRKFPRTAKVTQGIARPATFLVAIASSTGGPRALNELFSKIRKNPFAAFVIVQHISIGFTKALARRLSEVSPLTVEEAQESQCLNGGTAYIAPGGIHLVLEGTPGCYRFALDDQPTRLGVKPSADIMMASVAKAAGKYCLGVVLTGMGRDGTAGLKSIRAAGGKTLVQDAESCVVYGMPKSAMDAGLADRQLPLLEMASEINGLLSGKEGA